MRLLTAYVLTALTLAALLTASAFATDIEVWWEPCPTNAELVEGYHVYYWNEGGETNKIDALTNRYAFIPDVSTNVNTYTMMCAYNWLAQDGEPSETLVLDVERPRVKLPACKYRFRLKLKDLIRMLFGMDR